MTQRCGVPPEPPVKTSTSSCLLPSSTLSCRDHRPHDAIAGAVTACVDAAPPYDHILQVLSGKQCGVEMLLAHLRVELLWCRLPTELRPALAMLPKLMRHG